MKERTLEEIAELCNGQLDGGDPGMTVDGISTDSRSVQSGELFVALKGEVHNGHDHTADACEKGASALLVSHDIEAPCPRIRVDDTLAAYGLLGAASRDESDATVLAVTGSAGKTTTKDMLGAIVGIVGPALVAPGTENNEIGVPRLLLQLAPQHRFCVVELGMRGPGEIAYLANICRPHVGIITNIGEAHIGRLGSRETIAQAKAELLAALPDDGVAVLNADDFFFGLLSQITNSRVVSFGFGEPPQESEFHVTARDVRARGTQPASFTLCREAERERIGLRVPGRHNVANALAAAAAGMAAGASLRCIKAGLEDFSGSEMRSQVIQAPGGYTIVDDSYNASPTSTPEALRLLGGSSGRRVFVFGGMLELGKEAERAHREIGRLAAEVGVDWLITVGPHGEWAAEEADAQGLQVNVVAEVDDVLALLDGALEEGDTLLVKASRKMALERLVQALVGNE